MLRPSLLLILLAMAASAQTNPASAAARKWRQAHEREIVAEFVDLLAIPNLARDSANIRRNAQAISTMFTRRGAAVQLVEESGANPVVVADLKTPGATRTIALYAHYDGQPLDPAEWASPPFTPTLRDKPIEKDGQVVPLASAKFPLDPEMRLYARSASDDKAPILAMAVALDALRAAGLRTRSNIRFVFEGEEEAGSVNLGRILAAHKEIFKADLWLICDGPVAQTRQQLIAFGARGVTTISVTTYGARRELHSGHYGNWAPNPAMMLARLLTSMKDDSGRVLVPGFYEGIAPLSATEKRAIAEAPVPDRELMQELWLGSTESSPAKLLDLIQQPSFNIRSLSSSRPGALASNVIPATANASVDIRLVKGMDRVKTVERVIEHIRKQGYFVTDHEPSAAERMAHPKVVSVINSEAGYNAVRTSMDLPISQEVIRVVESARGTTAKWPTMGGSVPLEMIEQTLGTRTITIPIANHDNSQHTSNENIRIQNLWDGIELMAALIIM
jgi:acetylornithine deacetylase/succinyl-diaminopimelate desuccinylase-like protein